MFSIKANQIKYLITRTTTAATIIDKWTDSRKEHCGGKDDSNSVSSNNLNVVDNNNNSKCGNNQAEIISIVSSVECDLSMYILHSFIVDCMKFVELIRAERGRASVRRKRKRMI